MRSVQAPTVSLRGQFPVLAESGIAYLDSAATSQKPRAVLEAVERYYETTNANIHRGVHRLSQEATRLFDDARSKVARFLNAAEDSETLFTKGCTEAINLVAHCLSDHDRPSFGLQSGDVVLLSEMEHHSNIVPWQIAAARVGAKVMPIPVTDGGEIDLDAYARSLREHRVRMVGIVHISNALGTINPVSEMTRMAHDAGALVLVDGAQAGPHMRVDVQSLDADFYTLSCHKLYAPTGVGVLYGKRRLLEAMPPYHGGGDMIRTVLFEGTTYAGLPAKYEAGTPNIGGVIGLGAAVDWLTASPSPYPRERGQGGEGSSSQVSAHLHGERASFFPHETALARQAETELTEIAGVEIVGTARDKAAIVSFTVDGIHPHDLGTILDSEGVAIRAGHHCCMPLMKRLGIPATARASFAAYSDESDVEALIRGVRKAKEILG